MRERILVVDDNKALAKLIAKKMEQNVDMDVVVAHSFSEAKDILEENLVEFGFLNVDMFQKQTNI